MLIEVCDTCICRAASNPKSETCKDPHMQNLHALSYVENSQHFVFRSGRSRGRIGIANGMCQRHMFNIWLEAPTRQAQHVSASLAPCILRCDALRTSRRKPSKSGTPFLCGLLCIAAGSTSVYRSLPRPQMQANSKSSTRPNLLIGVS